MAPRLTKFACCYVAVTAASVAAAGQLRGADPLDYMDQYIAGSPAATPENMAKPDAQRAASSAGRGNSAYSPPSWMHMSQEFGETLATPEPRSSQPAGGQVINVRLDSELQFRARRQHGDYMDQYIAESGIGGKAAEASHASVQADQHAAEVDQATSWMHANLEDSMPRQPAHTAGDDAPPAASASAGAGTQVINVRLDSELQFGTRQRAAGDYMDQYIAESGIAGSGSAAGAEAGRGGEQAADASSTSGLHTADQADAAADFSRWVQPHFETAAAAAAPHAVQPMAFHVDDSSEAAGRAEAQSDAPQGGQVINVKLDSELQEAARSRRHW